MSFDLVRDSKRKVENLRRKGTLSKNGLKTCSKCLIEKLASEYYPSPKSLDGLLGKCRECYKQNRRANKLKKFDITKEFYEEILKNQNNECAICKKSFDLCSDYLDHCHKTNEVRGLLCRECNLGIGCLGDDFISVLNVVNYLGIK